MNPNDKNKAGSSDAATKQDSAARDAALRQRKLEIEVEQAEIALKKARLDLARASRDDARARASACESRTYTFCEPVAWETVRKAIEDLGALSRRFPGKPITIVLNSPGGHVMAGLALYDQIREMSVSGHRMTVKVRGMAASMGGILLQSGDKRVIGPEAMVLIHEVSAGTAGKVGEMEDDVKFYAMLWNKLAVILARRSKMSAKQIKDKAHKYDWWLDAAEAVRLGFADEIG